MFPDHGCFSASQGLCRSNKIQRFQLKDLAADNPGHSHPVQTSIYNENGNQTGTNLLQPVKHRHIVNQILKRFTDDHFDDNNQQEFPVQNK